MIVYVLNLRDGLNQIARSPSSRFIENPETHQFALGGHSGNSVELDSLGSNVAVFIATANDGIHRAVLWHLSGDNSSHVCAVSELIVHGTILARKVSVERSEVQ